VRVSMYSSIATSSPLRFHRNCHEYQSISLWPYASKTKTMLKIQRFQLIKAVLGQNMLIFPEINNHIFNNTTATLRKC
jgi:hypothetical protein